MKKEAESKARLKRYEEAPASDNGIGKRGNGRGMCMGARCGITLNPARVCKEKERKPIKKSD